MAEESFHQLVTSSLTKLDECWTELGLESNERKTFVESLLSSASELFHRAVQEQSKLRNTITEEIERLEGKHAGLASALGETLDTKEAEFANALGSVERSIPLKRRKMLLETNVAALDQLQERRKIAIETAHKRLWKLHSDLAIPGSQSKLLGNCEVPTFSDLSLDRVQGYRQEMGNLIEAKNEHDTRMIKGYWIELRKLWDLLKISDAEKLEFCNRVAELQKQEEQQTQTGKTSDAAAADYDDLLRSREKQMELFTSTIAELQAEQQRRLDAQVKENTDLLRVLWEKYRVQTGETISMPLPVRGSIENVTLIESLIVEMEDKLKQIEEIIKLIQRRNQLVAEEAQVLAAEKDPDRLLDKKRNMAAILLKEEKIRNAAKKELPKLEAKLRVFESEWERLHGSPFLYEGKTLFGRSVPTQTQASVSSLPSPHSVSPVPPLSTTSAVTSSPPPPKTSSTPPPPSTISTASMEINNTNETSGGLFRANSHPSLPVSAAQLAAFIEAFHHNNSIGQAALKSSPPPSTSKAPVPTSGSGSSSSSAALALARHRKPSPSPRAGGHASRAAEHSAGIGSGRSRSAAAPDMARAAAAAASSSSIFRASTVQPLSVQRTNPVVAGTTTTDPIVEKIDLSHPRAQSPSARRGGAGTPPPNANSTPGGIVLASIASTTSVPPGNQKDPFDSPSAKMQCAGSFSKLGAARAARKSPVAASRTPREST